MQQRLPLAACASPDPFENVQDIFEDYDGGAENASTILQNAGTVRTIAGSLESQKMVCYMLGKA